MRDLIDTVEMMNSPDYKERFKAEYYQLRIRLSKLNRTIFMFEEGTLEFVPTCSIALLRHQSTIMSEYLRDLELRALIEGIDL